MTRKVCPLMSGYLTEDYTVETTAQIRMQSTFEERLCLEDNCAWWDKEYSECSMMLLSRSLSHIRDYGANQKKE